MRSSQSLTEEQAFQVLNALPGVGPMTVSRLLSRCGGDPRQVLTAGSLRIGAIKGVRPGIGAVIAEWGRSFNLAEETRKMAASSTTFVSVRSAGYPRLLREIRDPPIGLYCRGRFSQDRPWVAIVGSRRASSYGLNVAKNLAGELARRGVGIASGLARGIDAAAHEGALAAGGCTVAVVGTGIDRVYPPEHRDLARRIAETGSVLSEYPFGRSADRCSFARRNRIISGLCEVVVVVESALEGGGLITAQFAKEQGRALFAVPGRLGDPESAGCHRLIRDGAELLSEVGDVVALLDGRRGSLPQLH